MEPIQPPGRATISRKKHYLYWSQYSFRCNTRGPLLEPIEPPDRLFDPPLLSSTVAYAQDMFDAPLLSGLYAFPVSEGRRIEGGHKGRCAERKGVGHAGRIIVM